MEAREKGGVIQKTLPAGCQRRKCSLRNALADPGKQEGQDIKEEPGFLHLSRTMIPLEPRNALSSQDSTKLGNVLLSELFLTLLRKKSQEDPK